MDGYLNGSLSAEDLERLQRWYDSFGESEAGVRGLESEQDAQQLGEELHTRIQQVVGPISPGTVAESQRVSWWRMVAAAAVLVVILSGMVWWTVQRHDDGTAAQIVAAQSIFREVKTGVRQIKKLTLPDGSVIHINANSTVRIPEQHGRSREVILDEGEAYFEVARDTLRPFEVQTPVGLRVEVLGTAFNVKAYDALDDVTVAVNRGKVRVSDTARVLGELTQNQLITYRKSDGQTVLDRLGTAAANDWIHGVSHLEKAAFDELALAMYNLYGVRLKSNDPRTVRHRYNLNLHADRSLEETMEVICSIHNTSYRRTDDEITIYF